MVPVCPNGIVAWPGLEGGGDEEFLRNPKNLWNLGMERPRAKLLWSRSTFLATATQPRSTVEKHPPKIQQLHRNKE